MNYEEKLKAAAKIILGDDSRAANAPLDVSNFGVTATLKPYQVEGVSWLIRRYTLGVNVVLGTVLVQLFPFPMFGCRENLKKVNENLEFK